MALWNNAELEKVKAENEQLHKQIRSYIIEKQVWLTEKEALLLQLEKSKTDCEGFETALRNSINNHLACEERVTAQSKEAQRLTLELKQTRDSKVHNERGAGRKSRITKEHILLANQWLAEGKGYAEVARLLSAHTKSDWSRSTVKYMVEVYCKRE